jgi:hypothetical protein
VDINSGKTYRRPQSTAFVPEISLKTLSSIILSDRNPILLQGNEVTAAFSSSIHTSLTAFSASCRYSRLLRRN